MIPFVHRFSIRKIHKSERLVLFDLNTGSTGNTALSLASNTTLTDNTSTSTGGGSLFGDLSLTDLGSLGGMDMLDEDTLVLEGVTLSLHVELVVTNMVNKRFKNLLKKKHPKAYR